LGGFSETTLRVQLLHRVDKQMLMKAGKQLQTALVAARAAKWVAAAVTFAAFVALLQGAPTIVVWLSAK